MCNSSHICAKRSSKSSHRNKTSLSSNNSRYNPNNKLYPHLNKCSTPPPSSRMLPQATCTILIINKTTSTLINTPTTTKSTTTMVEQTAAATTEVNTTSSSLRVKISSSLVSEERMKVVTSKQDSLVTMEVAQTINGPTRRGKTENHLNSDTQSSSKR